MNNSEQDRSIADVRVRLATLEDYAGFVVVAGETHAHHVAAVPGIFRSVAVAVPEEYFAQLVTGDDSDVIVAEVSGEIVGYAVLLHRRAARDMLVPRAYAHIENFGVAATYRREGIGRQLIEACVAQAKERGATSLELDCWEANREAMAFYSSIGMRVTRRYFAMDI
jgi:ribosomal protein S18 acetylase RimI-like enzyme